MVQVYLLFYSHVLQYFCHFNLLLQQKDLIIPIVHDQVIQLSACKLNINCYVNIDEAICNEVVEQNTPSS